MFKKLKQAGLFVRLIAGVTCFAFLASCATAPHAARGPEYAPTAGIMREARSVNVPVETRAADYLQAAAVTAPLLGNGIGTPACETYNAACGELTVLLRSSEAGRLWNRPLTLTGQNTTYHLRLQPGSLPAIWPPNYFSFFKEPDQIKRTLIKKDVTQEGVGGALVGVRLPNKQEEDFAPHLGLSAPVTATLDFQGSNAALTLRKPNYERSARVQGKVRPLEADLSAPISYFHPPNNLLLFDMLGMLRGTNMMEKTGLYFLEPYDPSRIPVVFVHGLMSSPFTWVKTINGLQQDPEVRKRYQPWVFGYATGNPILYSALRLREELAKVDKVYPNHLPYVIVGHSMGGMLTHAQVTTVTREMWEKDKNIGPTAKSIFANNSSNSLVVRAMTFRANPRINRVVFVCTPHRGSNMASGGIGRFGISLISLPFQLVGTLTDSLTGAQIAQITGNAKRLPNSVSGLKPTNPSFPVVNGAPMTVPYHSIIGDRGKGDCPNCTDGVVPYWSSHLEGAKSEQIVPGPHGSAELPQTIDELDRILRLNLGIKTPSKAATTLVQASR